MAVSTSRRSFLAATAGLGAWAFTPYTSTINAEDKANDLEEKLKYIEQFGPILVEGLARITGAKEEQKK